VKNPNEAQGTSSQMHTVQDNKKTKKYGRSKYWNK